MKKPSQGQGPPQARAPNSACLRSCMRGWQDHPPSPTHDNCLRACENLRARVEVHWHWHSPAKPQPQLRTVSGLSRARAAENLHVKGFGPEQPCETPAVCCPSRPLLAARGLPVLSLDATCMEFWAGRVETLPTKP